MLLSDLTHNQTHPRSHCHIYCDCLVLIGLHLYILWCKQSDSAIFANSRGNNSDSSGQIKSIIDLVRDLMVTYILTKFGADWLIFVDARV